VYAIASTADGQFGVSETSIRSFQPIIADFSPPQVLTVGDEINLPVPIRNYSDKTQDLGVSVKADESFEFPGLKENWRISVGAEKSKNAELKIKAQVPIEVGKIRITAAGKADGDAVEKPIRVVENAKKIITPQNAVFEKTTAMNVEFPSSALPTSKQLQIKVYPNALSHIGDSIEGLLKRPYGCGEQTTSSTYPNLMILELADKLGIKLKASLTSKAKQNLVTGYTRLLRYQTSSGFGYWIGNEPDLALTAYVLRFLDDAEAHIEIDETAVKKAERWLVSAQKSDGGWGQSPVVNAYIANSLARVGYEGTASNKAAIKAIDTLAIGIEESNDAYFLATIAIATLETEQTAIHKRARTRLLALGEWTTSKTPFNGWGRTASLEANAMAIQAVSQSKEEPATEEVNQKVFRAIDYLLRNKDRHGVWHSTQSTVAVLNALIARAGKISEANQEVSISLNGVELDIDEQSLDVAKPIEIKVDQPLQDFNTIVVKGVAGLGALHSVATYYQPWSEHVEQNKFIDFMVKSDRNELSVGEMVETTVEYKKKYRSGGMLIAEVGLPPGADVQVRSLEKIKKEKKIDSYEVLPDRIVFYIPGYKSTVSFSFRFKPRYGIKALAPASVIYDYYNEEAKAIVKPKLFVVR